MKVPALAMTDPWLSQVIEARNEVSVQYLREVPVWGHVLVEQVYFEYGDIERHFRPRLVIEGRLMATEIDADEYVLPYAITEIDHGETGPWMTMRYEFTTDELAQMVAKGYFEPGYEFDKKVTGINWQLPMTARLAIVPPEGENDPPIVFHEICDPHDLVYTKENSTYVLSEYFPVIEPSDLVKDERDAERETEQAVFLDFDEEQASVQAPGRDAGDDEYRGTEEPSPQPEAPAEHHGEPESARVLREIMAEQVETTLSAYGAVQTATREAATATPAADDVIDFGDDYGADPEDMVWIDEGEDQEADDEFADETFDVFDEGEATPMPAPVPPVPVRPVAVPLRHVTLEMSFPQTEASHDGPEL